MTLSDLIGLAEKAIAEYEAQYTKTRTCTIMPRDSNKSLVVHIDGMKQIQLSPEVVTALAKAAMALSETLRVLEACTTTEYSAAIKHSARTALSALKAAGIEQE